MKATLHFDDPEELQDALDGWKWKNVSWEIDKEMRSVLKHGHIGNREATDDEMEVTEYWREKLHELINDENLTL